MTRRIIKLKHRAWIDNSVESFLSGKWEDRPMPHGRPGDRLWVREAWRAGLCADSFTPRELDPGTWLYDNGGLWYPATKTEPSTPISPMGRYRHGRFMPRWASRILLEITDISVERLLEISEEDATAEGTHPFDWEYTNGECCESAREAYEQLWESIHGAGSWEANPLVWVISFRKIAQ